MVRASSWFSSRLQVPNGPQAADVMMTKHIQYFASTLARQQELNTDQQQEGDQQQEASKHPTNKQKSKQKSKQNQTHSIPPTARLSDAVLVVVSDDRGFREVAASWLNDGAGVVLVTARDVESWDTPNWEMSSDDRIEFIDWYDLL